MTKSFLDKIGKKIKKAVKPVKHKAKKPAKHKTSKAVRAIWKHII